MKNKRSAKILSLVLALFMAFSLVPVTASAEGTGAGVNGGWWNQGWGGWRNWGWYDPKPEPEPEEPVVEEPTEPEEPVTEEPTEPEVEYAEGPVDYIADDYTVTVSFTKEAQVPVDTKVTVREISFGSEEYADLYDQTVAKLNENVGSYNELDGDRRVGLTSAKFFDVTLVTPDGQEFEPAVPLQVNIHFNEGGLPQISGEESGVIHFGQKQTEIIEDVAVADSGKSTPNGMADGVLVDDFTYMQDGFSVVGFYTTGDYIDQDLPVMTLAESQGMLRASAAGIAAEKTVTDNDHDGIYDLTLKVTGASAQSQDTKVTKSNVIVIIDVSGSMDENTGLVEYTYSADTYDSYNTYWGRYYSYTYGRYRYSPVYHDESGWHWSDDNTAYTGTVYLNQTRLEATQSAARLLVKSLLANNKDENGKRDIIEISLGQFAEKKAVPSQNWNGTKMIVHKSTSQTDLFNAINGLSAGGGTNWEAALQEAKREADTQYASETDQETSIIFLTDGEPTEYGDDVYGDSTAEIRKAWTEASDDARKIINPGKYKLYNIFAYGTGTGSSYLKALTNYAYTGSGNYNSYGDTQYTRDYFFDAKDTSDLQKAFKAIIKDITKNVGFAAVNLSDGVSLGATNTSVTVDGTINEDQFLYSFRDKDNDHPYSVRIANGTATFTIGDATYTDDSPENVTVNTGTETLTAPVYSVTVDGRTYKMSPAVMNKDTGKLSWELAGIGILEDKATYSLTFSVWPNQRAYDIAADMNNGIYTSIDDAIEAYGITDADEIQKIKNAIVHNADGSYSVYTNYEQTVRYYTADEETVDGQTTTVYKDKGSDDLDQPDPVPLAGSKLPMQKRWGSDLAISELQELVFGKNNTYTGYHVTLKLKRDGVDYKSYTFPKLNGDNVPVDANGNVSTDATALVWSQDAAIAPGTMVTKNPGKDNQYKTVTLSGTDKSGNDISGTYYILSDGHEYTVEEAEGSDLHFEFETDTYHPMLVDGKLMNIEFASVGTNGQITDKTTATILDPNMTSVFATNTLKGGLNIRKVVTGPDKTTPVTDCTDEFTFKVTLTKDGTPYGTPADQYTDTEPADMTGWKEDNTDPEHPFWYKSGFSAYNVYVRGADGKLSRTQRGPIPANGELTLTMPANGEIRVVNLPTGTNYTVQEVVGNGGEYTYFKTVSAIKTGEDANGNDILEEGSTESTTNTVTGSVVGNKANLETYYNYAGFFYVYHSSNNRIEKISFADSRVTGTYENGAYKYTFNIADEVADNTLYGGYYHAYKGATINENQGATLTYTDNWAVDANGTAYSYQYIKDQNRSVWDLSKAYTTEVGATGGGVGTAMKPVVNQVYFLKEVPDGYLRPYNHYTYYKANNKIASMWIITALDDCCYQEAYFKITDVKTGATVANSVTIKAANSKTSTKLTADTIFKTSQGVLAGYIAHAKISDKLGQEILLEQFWTTPDGVDVHGAVHRTLDTSGNYGYKGKTHFTDDPYQP